MVYCRCGRDVDPRRKEKTVGCPASEKEARPQEQKEKRIRYSAGAAERQLGAVPAADEEGGREAAPRKGEADTEVKRGPTAVPDPRGGCDPAGIRTKKEGRLSRPSFFMG